MRYDREHVASVITSRSAFSPGRMKLAWFVGTCLLIGAPQADEAEFAKGVERVRRFADKEQWKRARGALAALLEEHRGERYVLTHLSEIRDELKRIEFWSTHDKPKAQALTGGDLERYSASTGQVKLRYRRGDLEGSGDFSRQEDLWFHPLLFDGSYTITLTGRELQTLADAWLIVVCADEERAIIIDPGQQTGTGYIARMHGAHTQLLASEPQGVLARGKPYEVKVTVRGDQIKMTCNKKRFLEADRDDLPWGQLGLSAFPEVLLIEGNATTAWIEGLTNAAVQGQWKSFEESFQADDLLPQWLVALAGEDGRTSSTAIPDPDYGEHARLWGELVRLLEKESLDEALLFARELDHGETTEAFRTYTLALVEEYLGRHESAVGLYDRVIELTPGFRYAHVFRAGSLRESGARERSIDALEELLRSAPGETRAWQELALSYLVAGRPEDAKRAVDRAIMAGAPVAELEEINGVLTRALRGPQWERAFEHESRNYRVRSDISNSVCLDASKILEEALQLFRDDLRILIAERAPRRTYQVYLFSGVAGYNTYAKDLFGNEPEQTAGLYTPTLKQLLIWNVPDRGEMLRVVRHEGLHQFLDSVLGSVPPWLNEGLAEYYETAEPTRISRRSGALHEANRRRLVRGDERSWPALGRLTTMGQHEFMRNAPLHYALSWALVHYLLQSSVDERARFDEYLTSLEGGATVEEAASVLLRGRDSEALRTLVRAHVHALRGSETR